MMKFKEYIAEASDYYYHGTSPEAAESILQHGFNHGKSLHGGKIFLTSSHIEASKYSKIANRGNLGTILMIHKKHLNNNSIVSNHSGIIEYNGHIKPEHIVKT